MILFFILGFVFLFLGRMVMFVPVSDRNIHSKSILTAVFFGMSLAFFISFLITILLK